MRGDAALPVRIDRDRRAHFKRSLGKTGFRSSLFIRHRDSAFRPLQVVGGVTLRAFDRIGVVQADGIVAGGGTAYVNIIPKVEKVMEDLKDDEKLGAKIVLKALEEPVKQIAVNAGLEPAVILEKVKQSPVGTGFNAKDEVYVDMKKAGIVDPTKVSRSALQNAASVASMVLTTESIVTDKKEPKECNCSHDDAAASMGGMY